MPGAIRSEAHLSYTLLDRNWDAREAVHWNQKTVMSAEDLHTPAAVSSIMAAGIIFIVNELTASVLAPAAVSTLAMLAVGRKKHSSAFVRTV